MLFQTDSSGMGYIQSILQGTAFTNLFLNPLGGNVGIKTATTTAALTINGNFAKTSVAFDIPHPLYPNTKHLIHMGLEGPRCDLIYRGTKRLLTGFAMIDVNTESTFRSYDGMEDGTFELLCANPQIILQNITGFPRMRGYMVGANLTIQSEDPMSHDVVSWMVIAERKDPYIKEWEWTDSEGYLVTQRGDKTA
jgi:hypothetical protein